MLMDEIAWEEVGTGPDEVGEGDDGDDGDAGDDAHAGPEGNARARGDDAHASLDVDDCIGTDWEDGDDDADAAESDCDDAGAASGEELPAPRPNEADAAYTNRVQRWAVFLSSDSDEELEDDMASPKRRRCQ